MMNPYGSLVHLVTTVGNIVSSLAFHTAPILFAMKQMLSPIFASRLFLKANPQCPLNPTSPSLLPDDVLFEIFLRLPAHPTCLLHTSLVCKRWHCLITGSQFISTFCVTHGALPVLGVFTNSTRIPRFLPTGDSPDCVATAAFSISDPCWQVLGCRHNLVLLVSSSWNRLQVWNPMTGSQQFVPVTPDADSRFNSGIVPESHAAVLCAAGHNDHADCHSCPFFVVWVFTSTRYAYVSRYSSENDTWYLVASSPTPSEVDSRPSVLIGDVLCWPLKSKYILAFELSTCSLYHIECPLETHSVYRRNVHIIKSEDGGLGLAAMTEFNLRLWAWETNAEGVAGWMVRKNIQLDAFLPPEVLSLSNNLLAGKPPARILGLVEDDDLVFIWTKMGVFAVQFKSMHCKKVIEADVSVTIYPYTGFYTTTAELTSVPSEVTGENISASLSTGLTSIG